ncbi:Ig-like domain-containing protein [Actinoplanes sp. NPDC049265]|uniref:Ig-like domain-containing protein n=1 Tax=Actinoplanes sp. NPDC049265 TaxID=3363902 RepID=UPI003719F5DB
MKIRGFATIVVTAGLIVAGAAAPAAAADVPVISSTGLTDGETVGLVKDFTPVISDDAVKVQVVVPAWYSAMLPWPNGALRAEFPAHLDGQDVNVELRAINEAGQSSEIKSTRVHVDGKAPKLTFRDPIDGSPVHGQTDIWITPDADTAEIVMTDPDDGTQLGRLTAKPWVFHFDFTGHDGRVNFRATDKVGNVSPVYEASYLVDTEGPVIRLKRPPFVQPGVQTLGVSVEDPSSVNRMEWYIDGALRSNGVSVQYDFGTQIRSVPMEIRAWDPWGNETIERFSVQIDANGPTITQVTPAELAVVRGTSLTSTVTATDPAGLDGAYLGVPRSGEGVRNGDTFSVPVSLGRDGLAYWDWMVRDSAGNLSSYRRQVIVDNTLATITSVTAPGNNAKVPATVNTSMTATDKNGIQRVELRVNGTTVLTDSKAPYNLNLDATKYGQSFQVAFYAVDKAGNVVSTSRRTWTR